MGRRPRLAFRKPAGDPSRAGGFWIFPGCVGAGLRIRPAYCSGGTDRPVFSRAGCCPARCCRCAWRALRRRHAGVRKRAEARPVRVRCCARLAAAWPGRFWAIGGASRLVLGTGATCRRSLPRRTTIPSANGSSTPRPGLARRSAASWRACKNVNTVAKIVFAAHPEGVPNNPGKPLFCLSVSALQLRFLSLLFLLLPLMLARRWPGGRATTQAGSGSPIISLRADATSARVCIRNSISGTSDFNIYTGEGLGSGLSLVRSLRSRKGARLSYMLDQPGSILATLCLAAPVVVAAIHEEKY